MKWYSDMFLFDWHVLGSVIDKVIFHTLCVCVCGLFDIETSRFDLSFILSFSVVTCSHEH